MKLKKINEQLQERLVAQGLTEPNEMQFESFSLIKSGADVVIVAGPKTGKTTTMVINVIQKLGKPFQQSPRALVITKDKESVLALEAQFKDLAKYNELRVYGVHDKSDLDVDKNEISAGIDILIGTTTRLNDMFTTAGFDVNQLKIVALDEAEELIKGRLEAKMVRLLDSIGKTQYLFFSRNITERLDFLIDRVTIEPTIFDMEAEDDEEDDYFDEEDLLDDELTEDELTEDEIDGEEVEEDETEEDEISE